MGLVVGRTVLRPEAPAAGVPGVLVFDPSGPADGTSFRTWPDLMAALREPRPEPAEIHFVGNVTITKDGMPKGGWDLKESTWHGNGLEFAVNEYLRRQRITIEDGVQFRNVPLHWLNDGLLLLSRSRQYVVDVPETRAFVFDGNVTLAATRSPIFRLSLRRGAVQFRLQNGSLIARPSILHIGTSDAQVIDIAGSPQNVTIQSISGQSGLSDDVVTGHGDLDININAAASEVTGQDQPHLQGAVRTVFHTRADAVGFTPGRTGPTATDVQGAIDQLAGTTRPGSGKQTNPPVQVLTESGDWDGRSSVLSIDASAGDVRVRLPEASGRQGSWLAVRRVDPRSTTVTIDGVPAPANTLAGAGASVVLGATADGWVVLARTDP